MAWPRWALAQGSMVPGISMGRPHKNDGVFKHAGRSCVTLEVYEGPNVLKVFAITSTDIKKKKQAHEKSQQLIR